MISPPRPRARSRVLTLVALLAALAGCVDPQEPTDAAPPTSVGQPTPTPRDEVASHEGEVCPEVLPRTQENHGFGTEQRAESAPTLLAPEEAWVCRYDPTDAVAAPATEEVSFEWVRAAGPSAVDAAYLWEVEDELLNLVPQPPRQACNDDLGSRYMLVYSHGKDLTGVVADDFGCRAVRLTDETFETVPGESTSDGVVSGVLAANPSLLPRLRVLYATVPGDPVHFGPTGVGALRLGMTRVEVAATGLATTLPGSRHDGWRRGCFVLEYRPALLGRTPGNSLNGALSADQGLEVLYATYAMVTPQGVRLGSTIDEVRTAYGRPGLEPGDQLVVHASKPAIYRIFLDEVVTSMQLESRRPECTI